MSWLDQVGNLLRQYTTSGAATAPARDVQSHFDDVAQAAPSHVVADGLAAAFRSDQTPAFGQMLSALFANSNDHQKSGAVNQLIASASPALLARLLPGLGLGEERGNQAAQLTPEQARNISPEVVQQLGEHAEKNNPSVVDSLSSFYAQHSGLVKTLGGTALTIALAKMAERQRQA
jgi:hypothetical protein